MDRINIKFVASFIFLGILASVIPAHSQSAVQEEILTRQQQIEQIQRQIEQYEREIAETRGQARTLQGEINVLNSQIRQIELTIRSLELSLGQTSSEIQSTEQQIQESEEQMEKYKDAITQLIKLTNESDKKTLTHILLSNQNLSDFFKSVNDVYASQEKLATVIREIKKLKLDLEERQAYLEEKKSELERTRGLEALEKRSLDQNKAAVNRILKETQGKEAQYQSLVQKSKKDIEAIRAQIYYLEQSGITAEDAIKFGQLAALRAGIRPAYLIAVLEVESGLGRNVGRCNRAGDPPSKKWEAIMHTRDHKPFIAITSQLGLDPNNTPVSCPQFVNGRQYGWGGAMGPAQFIPSTWIAYAEEVGRLVGRSANPWNIEDAFVAAAVKLARGGATAQTRASEIAASKAYYSGNSRCSTAPCNSYANAIQRKAAEIEKNL